MYSGTINGTIRVSQKDYKRIRKAVTEYAKDRGANVRNWRKYLRNREIKFTRDMYVLSVTFTNEVTKIDICVDSEKSHDVKTDCEILEQVKIDKAVGFVLGLIDKSDWSVPVEDHYGALGGAIMINLEVYNRFEGADAVLEAWNMHGVKR